MPAMIDLPPIPILSLILGTLSVVAGLLAAGLIWGYRAAQAVQRAKQTQWIWSLRQQGCRENRCPVCGHTPSAGPAASQPAAPQAPPCEPDSAVL